ncbi:TPA: conjugal transfer protein TraD [Legionella pneumophila]|nr:conjugal transfer protein TraD [Legionella pneumophila]HAU1525505.1 conjugal transfer protein TraD [Legionella pneumophila]HAU1540781.1 conjugal transfer protein TraD [Legionella pneumophila]HBD7333896.1 conjugal transfer protein TraD [Legionella pneumophila]HBD9354898.1 conjugal transfer protein TraD [Legionella pneumophila]
MDTLEQIKKEKQAIAKGEQTLALAKLKKRRADTRRKIELGGLVIKSGMDVHNKSTILGALDHVFSLMHQDSSYIDLFQFKGNMLFLIEE